MDDQILAIYCLCDDILKALGHHEDPQCQMSDAEVLTTAIVAALYFGGNLEHARPCLNTPSYIPTMLSKSRLNRRLHAISDLFHSCVSVLGEVFKSLNTESLYLIDSFPIASCDNIRIPRAKRHQGKHYRGYTASKRRYFYGLKIFLLTTAEGEPVEVFFTPGAEADVSALPTFDFDLPPGSTIYGDKAFNLYDLEDLLQEAAEIKLLPLRKRNSTRAVPPYVAYLQHHGRKMVETAGSLINRLLPKSIHAVTPQGFELKLMAFILAYSVSLIV